ncbi:globin family protein [Bosea sp. 117]|uniref:globin family protein n=1 Tax=Bosea sp. 117 TaxID=1125973 RepID=UPI0004949DD7|nr:globin family protein [Bosea sp. 117]
MTPDQIVLLRRSIDGLRPHSEQAAALFYGRLFEMLPEVRPLFTEDMVEQGRKLMRTLVAVMNGIDDMRSLRPAVERLGQRHLQYGVRQEHYEPVGVALIWALEQGLGDAFTPDTRSAWLKAYDVLTQIMLDAAGNPEAAEPAP